MRSSRTNRLLSGWICSSCQLRLVTNASQTKGAVQCRSKSSTTRKAKIPNAPARTRFAPSPTGDLHLGSIRTALFNYLLAKRTKGQFLLRIEDTDRKRTIPGAEDRIFQDLRWAGLQWDEGPMAGGPYGPYRQSERTALYQAHVKPLLENKKAYRCFCSPERLKALQESRHEKGLRLGYDRKCADIPSAEAEEKTHKGHQHVIRFQVPRSYPKYDDLIYGKIGHGGDKGRQLFMDEPVYDDPILIKSDGFPTYHFANVVDDQLMKITHVIRGSEWMTSTPLHVALYEAFGWNPPAFAHVPLLVDENRQKLSKRNMNTDIASFRSKGIFPEALVNFTALLGWSHQLKSDVLDLQELEEIFDLKITKGNTIVSFDKLRFLQEQHAWRRVGDEGENFEQMIRDVASALLDQYGAGKVLSLIGKRHLRDVVALMLRIQSLHYQSAEEFAKQAAIFFNDPPALPSTQISDPAALRIAAATFCLVPENAWTTDVHRTNLNNLELGPKSADGSPTSAKKFKNELYHYLREVLLGGAAGPGIPETMEILGRDTCVARIQAAALQVKNLATMQTTPSFNVERIATAS